MREPTPDPRRSSPAAGAFPRVPGYAWGWLQRSRPVLAEVARRLSGGAPDATFFDRLRARFAEDAFTRAIVCDVIADVAFSGRVPEHRPSGSSWDRGLVWWAATLAGKTPAEYDRSPSSGEQRPLFPTAEGQRTAGAAAASRTRPLPVRGERAALAAALRSLLASAEGESVPAAAIRALLADLERG